MNWKEQTKTIMTAIADAFEVISEIRDEIISWGITKKQADNICIAMVKAALMKSKE